MKIKKKRKDRGVTYFEIKNIYRDIKINID
jgi:hypothetical protein